MGWVLVLLTGGFTFLDYWSYSQREHADPGEWARLLAGRGIAPAQYRVGVLRLGNALDRVLHAHLRHSLAAIDGLCLLLGLLLVTRLLLRTRSFRLAALQTQWAMVLFFFATLQLYLVWSLWYQQPETMATFLFVALSATLAWPRAGAGGWLAAAALVCLAAVQATVRADAAIAFHLGFAGACLLPQSQAGAPLRRGLRLTTSVLSIAAAVLVQLYIARVVYPGAQRNTALVQLWSNLHAGMGSLVLLFALVPWALTLYVAARQWRTLDGWSHGLLLGSVVHFAMFFTVGMSDEVRVFLPFAMGVLPITAPLVYGWLVEDQRPAPAADPAVAAAVHSQR